MQTLITLVGLFGLVHGAAYSSYMDNVPIVDDTGLVPPLTVTLPQNNCGYSNVEFDPSYNNQIASNDTVWFFESYLPSNCGPQTTEQGCVTEMYMTGPYDFLGKVPYAVNYYFSYVGSTSTPVVSLYYNYNNSATHMIASVPCNGVQDFGITLSKCMFTEELYHYQFFTHYQFNFYLSCSYDRRSGLVDFNLDQESLTCIGGPDCQYTRNRFNLVNFNDWSLETVDVNNGASQDFCQPTPPPPPPPPTTTVAPPVTQTVTVTPTVTTTTCKSCANGDVVININNSNTNSASSESNSDVSLNK
jgi:hypothetical protein